MAEQTTTTPIGPIESTDAAGGGARIAAVLTLMVLLGVTVGQIYWAGSQGGQSAGLQDGRQVKDFAYVADEAYEHLIIARDLATEGWSTPGVDEARATKKTTPLAESASPGWSLLLASLLQAPALSAESGRSKEEVALVPLALNLLAAAVLVLVAGHLVRREVRSGFWMFALLLAMGALIPLPLLVMAGMEHVLHMCILLLTVSAGIAAAQSDRGSIGWTFLAVILAAACVALRYESLAVLVGLLLWGWVQGYGLRKALPALAGAAVVIAVGWYLTRHGAAWLPAPVMAHWNDALGSNWRCWPSRAFERAGQGIYHAPLLWTLLLIAVALLAKTRSAAHAFDWLGRERVGWLFVFVLAAMAHLLVGPTNESRQTAYLVPLGAVAIGRALAATDWADRKIRVRGTGLIAVLCVVPVLIVAMPKLVMFVQAGRAARDAFVRERVATSFIRTYFPTGLVAVNQPGIVGYETEARVVDLSRRDPSEASAQVALIAGAEPRISVPPTWKRIGGWYRQGTAPESNSAVRVYAVSDEYAEVVKIALQRASLATNAPADVDYWFADAQSAPATRSVVLSAQETASREWMKTSQRPGCEASCH